MWKNNADKKDGKMRRRCEVYEADEATARGAQTLSGNGRSNDNGSDGGLIARDAGH